MSAILLSKTLSHFTNRIRHENNQRNEFTQKRTNLQHEPFYLIPARKERVDEALDVHLKRSLKDTS